MSSPLVLWDFDGTLARRECMWSGALLGALTSIDPTTGVAVEALRPHLASGFPWHDPDTVRPVPTPAGWWAMMRPVFVAAYRGVGVDPDRAAAAADRVPVEFYRVAAWTVIDDAPEALARTAAAGMRNMILSNHGPELPALVAALGLDQHVQATITSAAVGAEKPNPAIFEHALSVAGPSGGVWMVGDNPVADLEGASRAGILGILIDAETTVLDAAERIVATPST